jgi:hypothetical protein
MRASVSCRCCTSGTGGPAGFVGSVAGGSAGGGVAGAGGAGAKTTLGTAFTGSAGATGCSTPGGSGAAGPATVRAPFRSGRGFLRSLMFDDGLLAAFVVADDLDALLGLTYADPVVLLRRLVVEDEIGAFAQRADAGELEVLPGGGGGGGVGPGGRQKRRTLRQRQRRRLPGQTRRRGRDKGGGETATGDGAVHAGGETLARRGSYVKRRLPHPSALPPAARCRGHSGAARCGSRRSRTAAGRRGSHPSPSSSCRPRRRRRSPSSRVRARS